MKPLIALLLLLLAASCSRSMPKPLSPAFFCWETTLRITPSERELLDSLTAKKLYVKILDIGRNAGSDEIEPYARLEIPDFTVLAGLEVIPTIFITNEVFQNISEEKLEWLADKIGASAALAGPYKQVLFDCDWSPSTRMKFFRFLEKMQPNLPSGTLLSATIRLHQYKFPQQTGVPPVDRGMLMFYNTGDVDAENEHNSIFHPEDALKYLDGAPKNYPLPLDLALPVFSWGLIFREGELWKIVPGPLPLSDMRQNGNWLENSKQEPFAAQLWEPKAGTFLGGHYLRPGDHLRVSEISPELLFEVAKLAQEIDLADDADVAFFHLGMVDSTHFSAQLLDRVCKTIRK